jgi:phosphosulfolactate synthase (CoM biosynthesis protein A)
MRNQLSKALFAFFGYPAVNSTDQIPFFINYNVRERGIIVTTGFTNSIIAYIPDKVSQYLIDCLHSG